MPSSHPSIGLVWFVHRFGSCCGPALPCHAVVSLHSVSFSSRQPTQPGTTNYIFKSNDMHITSMTMNAVEHIARLHKLSVSLLCLFTHVKKELPLLLFDCESVCLVWLCSKYVLQCLFACSSVRLFVSSSVSSSMLSLLSLLCCNREGFKISVK